MTHTKAIMYVKNTNGGATLAHFVDDHEPIGSALWDELLAAGLVTQDYDKRIRLTSRGEAFAAKILGEQR